MKVIVCTELRLFQSCKDVMLSNDCPGKLEASRASRRRRTRRDYSNMRPVCSVVKTAAN